MRERDALTTAALIGSAARSLPTEMQTGTALDALLGTLPDTSAERRLLLQAGARAIYRQAGALPAHIETDAGPFAPAPAETLAACSAAVAELMLEIFTGQLRELLPEACERMRQHGLRLPFALLPMALNARDAAQRTALAPVLGERGLWLARLQPAWSWVTDAHAADAPSGDAQTLWQEGTTKQRVAVLRRLRAGDPAKARDWIRDVWKRERAEVRAELLATVEIGLSAGDEALLETALDDRAESVTLVAATLLARLPGSAFAERMRARADALLALRDGALVVTPPPVLTPTDQRDGLRLKPQRGLGERAWWLAQTLKYVPLAHWEARLGMAPEAIVAAADANEWSAALIEGWAESATLQGGVGWILPLWRRCTASREPAATYARNLRARLAQQLPRDEIEGYAADLLAEPKARDIAERIEAVEAIPVPWSAAFTEVYWQALQRTLGEQKRSNDYSWATTVRIMAAAIPASHLDRAIEVCTLAPESTERKHLWSAQVDTALTILRGRQRLGEVLPV